MKRYILFLTLGLFAIPVIYAMEERLTMEYGAQKMDIPELAQMLVMQLQTKGVDTAINTIRNHNFEIILKLYKYFAETNLNNELQIYLLLFLQSNLGIVTTTLLKQVIQGTLDQNMLYSIAMTEDTVHTILTDIANGIYNTRMASTPARLLWDMINAALFRTRLSEGRISITYEPKHYLLESLKHQVIIKAVHTIKQAYDKGIEQGYNALQQFKNSLNNTPEELKEWSLKELARQYYLRYAQILNIELLWGVSVEELIAFNKIPPAGYRLDLSRCKITDLTGIHDLPDKNAYAIWLSNNYITIIPADIFNGFEKVKNIFLNNNQIEFIAPSIFTNLNNLITVDLSDNNLQTIPIIQPKTIKRLKIENNRLSDEEIERLKAIPGLIAIGADEQKR